jgi:hypothetical protein
MPDLIGVGLLAAAFPPSLIDAVVAEAGARELRHRKLPAWVVVYFVMALALFMHSGYPEVWNKLLAGLEWTSRWRLRPTDGSRPSTAALTKARARLGWQVMAELLERVSGPDRLTQQQTPSAFYQGMRRLVIDTTTIETQDTVPNQAGFGAAGQYSGPPRVRVAALADCATGRLRGVRLGGCRDTARVLTQPLWERAGQGDLVMAGPELGPGASLAQVLASGAEVVMRTAPGLRPPVTQVLPDGSYLSRVFPTGPHGQPPDGHAAAAEIELRVIEYTRWGDQVYEPYCLVTSLTDPQRAPRADFPDLYARRWHCAAAMTDFATWLSGQPDVMLRSKTPDMVRQELYGILCAYQAIHSLGRDVHDPAQADARRVAFARAPGSRLRRGYV